MKILLTENQTKLILEVSKKDVLIQKLGFNENKAEYLFRLCGPLSVWMANKIIESIKKGLQSIRYTALDITNDTAVYTINSQYIIEGRNHTITSIMDWIRVGLNGNINEYKNLTFSELKDKANEWHESLNIGEGEINYVEKNKIIRDYRKDGIGFYWTNLNTNDSPEECDRMGHCGRTSYSNTIYSLRENKRINDKFTINVSHLTAAVGNNDGIIYQMKGPKNSKPQSIFHPYIVDLLLKNKNINGFGSEYNSSDDFSLGDLDVEQVKKIYSKKPILFNNRKGKKILSNMGIIPKIKNEMVFDLTILPTDISSYVEGDWVISTYKKDNQTYKKYFFESLLSGDIWDIYENTYEDSWKYSLHMIDKENTETLKNILNNLSKKSDIDISDLDLEEAITELDDEYNIRSAINSAISDAEAMDYYDHAIKQLTKCLSEYGTVTKLNDEGAVIKIDLEKIISDVGVGDDDVEQMFEVCSDELSCVLIELIGDYHEKPKFYLDDRYSPDADEKTFNETLTDRLGEIEE